VLVPGVPVPDPAPSPGVVAVPPSVGTVSTGGAGVVVVGTEGPGAGRPLDAGARD
jgi:hypothetical protein